MSDVREIPSPFGILRLRPERDEDEEFRYRLFCDSREPEFALLEPAAFEQVMTQQFHAQTLSSLARFPRASFEIIELCGERIGRIVVDRPGAMLQVVDQAIVPQWRGRGIGTAIVRALMSEAEAAGVPVRIEPPASDLALRFCRRLGFVPVETLLEWHPRH
jgi:GNAT superfamily N-acetyltransferase